MAANVEDFYDTLTKERLATQIADSWLTDDLLRAEWKKNVQEVMSFVFATDATQTTNADNPWKNKTIIPKICQTRDNLIANYLSTIFPGKKKYIDYEANERDPNSIAKRDAIVNYMRYAISQPGFRSTVSQLISDYIDYGNAVAMPEWIDERVIVGDKTQVGYIGPGAKRISPLDIVAKPTASSWYRAPKIIRSLISMGECKELLEGLSTNENSEAYREMWKYLRDIRANATTFQGDWIERDENYMIAGFTSFREYLASNTVEVLTFYGDIYDDENDIFLKNHVIMVVDRHRIISKKPNPSFFGFPPIFHSAWRKRPDNLWGMGPLENLIGMQYRMNHVENTKADIYDFTAFPVQKVRGYVQDYVWEPAAKIYVDDEGDVEILAPDVNALQANFEIDILERRIEEMAGAPKEAMGFRTPGEKTAYEVTRLENAAARIFQNKIRQFEEEILEPLLNSMLELAKRNMTGVHTIQVFDNEFNTISFQDLTVQDITGSGRIRPVASRHFAEQAELIQNLTNLTNSNLWPFIQQHFSASKLAKIVGTILNLDDYEVVLTDVAIYEQAETQKKLSALQEQVATEQMTASGIGEDYDLPAQETMGLTAQALQQVQAQ